MSGRRRAFRVLDDPRGVERAFPSVPAHPAVESPNPDATSGDDGLAEAREQAYREGLNRAAEQFRVEVEEFRDRMAQTLRRLADLERSARAHHESELLELAIEAASRIVRERLDSGDPVAARALRDVLEEHPTTGRLQVRLHPDDVDATARELADEIGAGRIELHGDAGVSRGGCVVEGPVGTTDATLERACRAVREALRGEENATP